VRRIDFDFHPGPRQVPLQSRIERDLKVAQPAE
jgi:hypothetical protein